MNPINNHHYNFAAPPQTNYNAYNHTLSFHRHIEPSYTEFHEDFSDYTFLPKTTFFENYNDAPLNISRHNTAITDSSVFSPQNQRPTLLMPNQAPRMQSQDTSAPKVNFGQMEALIPPVNGSYSKFTAVIGANSGLAINSVAQEKVPDQPYKLSLSFKAKDTPEKIQPKQAEDDTETIKTKVNVEEEEAEPKERETLLNAQLKGLLKLGLWSEEKDQTLLKLGTQYKCDWKKIAKRFSHKKVTPHFLKIRYKELIFAPLQRRIKFTHKEDLMITKYFDKYGSNWAQMASHFTDRTAIMLKNRYYSFIRKKELLESLLQEVREIEKNNQEVDQLPETEVYTTVGPNGKEIISPEEDETSPSTMEEVSSLEKERKHHIFGYEAKGPSFPAYEDDHMKKEENIVNESSEQNRVNDPSNQISEIQYLKEQVKKFKYLYLQTKSELDRLTTNSQIY